MASAPDEFANYCCELLSSVGACVAKRMFGGYGISTDGLSIAILADLGQGERLWLKASEQSIAQFEQAGCARFTYLAKGQPKSMSYYSAPESAMDSIAEMAPWARLALEAALASRMPKKKAPTKVASSPKKK
jgi:DNA transformation protein